MSPEGDREFVDVVAYYLPQFYPMELNSKYWGEGYTEWNAVVAAQRGWRSPSSSRLTPGELGFYDLRSTDIRKRQGELARQYGISAFAIYHYWSCGERVMPEVVDKILEDDAPDIPFFFCWANHDWTLAWQGRPDVVTWAQGYDEHENDDHIEWLISAFMDRRYYKIDGCPVIAVYAVQDVPRWRSIVQRWRTRVAEAGFPGLVVLGVAPRLAPPPAARESVDAWVESPGAVVREIPRWRRALMSIDSTASLARLVAFGDYAYSSRRIDAVMRARRRARSADMIPAVLCRWNNAGRRNRGAWVLRTTPGEFCRQLAHAIREAPAVSPSGSKSGRRIVMINAWNEWGEGMSLEPSVEYGREYLEAVNAARAEAHSGPDT